MAELEIVCINKPDRQSPHEAINRYGLRESTGVKSYPRQVVVDWVKEGNRAYVQDSIGKVYCQVRKSPAGTEFLQTVRDNRWTDNLLSLPECR